MRKLLNRRTLRWAAIAAGVLFVLIQLIPADRSNPPVGSQLPAPPTEVEAVLRKACYDCHSHETAWPWYSYVAPVSWWVVDHVEHGRGHLNFSDWPALDFQEQQHLFEEIAEMLEEDEMPLTSYRLLHGDARLSADEIQLLMSWAESQH